MHKFKGLPTKYSRDIFEINYEELKKQGIKTLFFDLDNTIIPYDIEVISNKTFNFLSNLSKDFNLYIISNNNKKRVLKALDNKNFKYLFSARKPFIFKLKKLIKDDQIKLEELYLIGDQIWTDIKAANKLKIRSILVMPIKSKSDIFITKISRILGKRLIKQVKRNDYNLYLERLEQYDKSF